MPTTRYALDYLVAGIGSRDISVNVDLNAIDKALGGYLTKAVGGNTNVTLTAAEYRYRSLQFTGVLTGNIAVIVPATHHLFTAYNMTTGAFTLTVRTSGGTGIAVPSGNRVVLVGNGTDIYTVMFGSMASPGANSDITSLSGLTTPLSTPQGGTGQAVYVIGDLLYASATGTLSRLADTAVGRLLISGGVATAPAWSTSPVLTLLHLLGASSGDVTIQVAAAAGTWTLTLPTSGGTLGHILQTNGSGVTSWVAPVNVATLADAATVTPNVGTDGRSYLGILTSVSQATLFANPTGTPIDGQLIKIRIISIFSQTVTFGSKYKDSLRLPKPASTRGSSQREYWTFQYVLATDTYDLLGVIGGIA